MIIKNGKVFQEDGSYKVADLYVENGRIVTSADELTDKTELDASGLKVLPGLVDIHSMVQSDMISQMQMLMG